MFKVLAVIFFLLACMVVLGYFSFFTVSEAIEFIGEYRRLKVNISEWTIIERDAREDFNDFKSLHQNDGYSADDYDEYIRCREVLYHAEDKLRSATYDMKRLWEDKFIAKIIIPVTAMLAVAAVTCMFIHAGLGKLSN